MENAKLDTLLLFDKRPGALPLYEAFMERLLALFPDASVRVQKTQISISNRHMFACVSLQRVARRPETPGPHIVITLGLPCPLASARVAAQTEPYPGRWTAHIVIGRADEIDDELMEWVRQAYFFAQSK